MLAAATVAGNLVQGPPALSLKPLTPQWSRLAPLGNLRKVFSLRQWVEVVKIVVKLSLYTSVAFTAARDAVLATPTGASGAAGTLRMLLSMSGTVIFRVTLLAAGLAVLDYLFRRYDHTRSLKMSKKEVRDERREMEGDPLVRARIRSKQLSLARSRMMVDVAKATVVVTNPTHYAVALRYVPDEMDVPRVVAKGRERIAARIREIASGHGIPIVSDPPLARSLYKSVPIGRDVPPALFRAVAEVLALVLKPRRRGPAREHRP
jgi:flagellar biosynthetic protein FlhB